MPLLRQPWPIRRERTALIVVDMQRVFCESDGALYVPATESIIAPIKTLAQQCRQHGLPVIYLRHVLRGDGSDSGRMRDLYPDVDQVLARNHPQVEIINELRPQPGDITVDKLFYSGFHNTDLDTILRARDIDTLLICGTVTNVCCDTTLRDAVHREYKVIALSDAMAAMPYPDLGFGAVSAEEVQKVALTTFAYEFGEVAATASVLSRIAS
ncbi:isochorismatase [Saccharospirillum sp. MSK14-1]|uniref:cysteine hydrolase family protein n=1 Tax=Saccharospirillum sp. MSK14-1 TaxID=1897632 RepID=UPI000D3648D4|nr:isochorismatase family cysteine hydrolase [Saccharospirillum sp. MSK14-1]PTY37941.1 isochorismatase [Saccharospirillum sp. MSK14-1]